MLTAIIHADALHVCGVRKHAMPLGTMIDCPYYIWQAFALLFSISVCILLAGKRIKEKINRDICRAERKL